MVKGADFFESIMGIPSRIISRPLQRPDAKSESRTYRNKKFMIVYACPYDQRHKTAAGDGPTKF
jgi:undecaprenyl pyrophosphate synthase